MLKADLVFAVVQKICIVSATACTLAVLGEEAGTPARNTHCRKAAAAATSFRES